jgi:hypothetical protein
MTAGFERHAADRMHPDLYCMRAHTDRQHMPSELRTHMVLSAVMCGTKTLLWQAKQACASGAWAAPSRVTRARMCVPEICDR